MLCVLRVLAVLLLALVFVPHGTTFAGTTFVVTRTDDPGDGVCDGSCTLREAIDAANSSGGSDVIAFNIPGSPPFTIQPGSPLPEIIDPVTIDGTTQPGFDGAPIIELNGESAGNGVSGLAITAGNSTVRGLVIDRFSDNGILIMHTGGNVVQGNFIGTDVTGTTPLSNGGSGVVIAGAASNNLIGGTEPGARNLISGNAGAGVSLWDAGTTGNTIQGNFIGTDVTGTATLGNAGIGVALYDGAANNQVGGTEAGAGNLISGNSRAGVVMVSPGTNENRVQENLIGTSISGTASLGNAEGGVAIADSASGNQVGGTEPGDRNLISGNAGHGVAIADPGTTSNRIQGNFIGTDPTGTLALGNGLTGVVVTNDATGNSILSNSIRSNGGLGIDLGDDGVTANDARDRDSGPNGLQNFPVLSPPFRFHGVLSVGGVLASKPNSTYRVELFGVAECDASGNGEGEVYLGFKDVTTGPSGGTTFLFQLPPDFPPDHFVTATATDAAGSTSEFSRCAGPTVP